jgi:hypothetical protein
MEMRKFIIEIHPDGKLTWCEYETPEDAALSAKGSSWLAGYKRALTHCDEQVSALKGIQGTNITAGLIYQGASYVRDRVAKMYQNYYNDAVGDPRRKCPDCGCCCDYESTCCDMKGGNTDHPGGCKKL